MKISPLLLAAALLAAPPAARAQDADALRANDPPAHGLWLETLDLSLSTQDYGQANAGKSVDGHPLTLNGVVYPHGVGTHANSDFAVSLHGAATRFAAVVGVDDEEKNTPGSVTFTVLVDGKALAKTGVLPCGRRAATALGGPDGGEDADPARSATAATASATTTPTGPGPRSPWPTARPPSRKPRRSRPRRRASSSRRRTRSPPSTARASSARRPATRSSS